MKIENIPDYSSLHLVISSIESHVVCLFVMYVCVSVRSLTSNSIEYIAEGALEGSNSIFYL